MVKFRVELAHTLNEWLVLVLKRRAHYLHRRVLPTAHH